MEWKAPAPRVAMRIVGDIGSPSKGSHSMEEISAIGLDLPKSVFQVACG